MRYRGPAVLAAIVLVPVILWLTAAPLEDRFVDTRTTLISLAVVCALAGVTSFAMNLVLGARLKLIDSFFGGLDRMYRTHRINGRVAFLLILTHAVLIVASRATIDAGDALGILTGREGWTVMYGVIALVALAVGIYLTLYVRLNHELFVYVQRSFGVIFLLASLHVFRTPGTKALSPALTYFMFAVAGAGIVAWLYRSIFGDSLVRKLEYRVSNVNRLDQSVTELTLTPEDKPLNFTPGQFAFITLYSREMDKIFHPFDVVYEGGDAVFTVRSGAVRRQAHPFSITSSPDDRDLKVAVKALGDFTRALRAVEHGAFATVEGPYGAFCHIKIPNRRQIWVAGGIGITPFLSMARSMRGTEFEIDFFYAMETGDEGYFLDELFELADQNPRMKVIPIRRDRLGFMTADDIEGVTKDLRDKDILICGPPPMIDGLTAQLVAKGVPRNQIHFEKFGFAG
jgi:predicted ferric reductase